MDDLCEDEICHILKFSSAKIINSLCQVNIIYKKIILHYLVDLTKKEDLLVQAVDDGCLFLVRMLLLDEMKMEGFENIFKCRYYKYPEILKELLNWRGRGEQKFFDPRDLEIYDDHLHLFEFCTLDTMKLLMNWCGPNGEWIDAENMIDEALFEIIDGRDSENIIEFLFNWQGPNDYTIDQLWCLEVASLSKKDELCDKIYHEFMATPPPRILITASWINSQGNIMAV